MPRHIEVVPSASRLMHSLRGADYSFVTAVADLVDNSIAANAKNIRIRLVFAGESSWVRIDDDGDGMDARTLAEAMRYGSLKDSDYDPESLGKFGLGLKTASLSQCRQVTVASRVNRDRRYFNILKWDLDKVKDAWKVEDLDPDEVPKHVLEPLEHRPGTAILWENLDNVIHKVYAKADGKRAKDGFFQLIDELNFHLGLVFHRFIEGTAHRKRPLTIYVNDHEVEPCDPLASRHRETQHLKPQTFEISAASGGRGEVVYRPYVLPTRDKLSPSEQEQLGRPDGWAKGQGFYVYRNDRLIRFGGWLNRRTADEHLKLARVALDFDAKLDEEFKINIAKERVALPHELREKLDPHLKVLWEAAQRVYRKEKAQAPADEPAIVAPRPRAPATSSSGHGSSPRTSSLQPSADFASRVRQTLISAAEATIGQNGLQQLLEAVEERDEEVARALGY